MTQPPAQPSPFPPSSSLSSTSPPSVPAVPTAPRPGDHEDDAGVIPSLRGQCLRIPDLAPAFAAWKQGVNPLHERVRQAVDARLGEVLGGDEDGDGIGEEVKAGTEGDKKRMLERLRLEKVRAADLGLFAAGLFPDASYDILETAAFYNIWLFLWDDAIDGGSEPLDAEEYCRRSVAFVEHALCHSEDGDDDDRPSAPAAPTKVCASFADVARSIRAMCEGRSELAAELASRLREYMEGCVTEYRWRMAKRVPSVDEFYGWRLKTSSVDVFLVLTRILNGITLPREILESREVASMGLSVNKLLIQINELFSLKKELKDGAVGNLIPITMLELGTDLEGAVYHVVHDIRQGIREYNHNASAIRSTASRQFPDCVDQVDKLIAAYQAIATAVLNFSINSPRYGLLKYRQPDGSFVVEL